MSYFIAISCVLFVLLQGLPSGVVAQIGEAEVLNVYSARKEALIKPLLDDFSKATDIKVNLITGKADALITRIKTEGNLSPADILLMTDAGRLVRAKQAGITQSIENEKTLTALPDSFKDTEGHWLALTYRARTLVYAPDRVNIEQLDTLEELADPKWRGRICIRSSSNIYNQSLVAALLEKKGREQTKKWAEGFVGNFARAPKGGDRDQIKAVVAGLCDVAIVNNYYLAGMLNSSDSAQQKIAQKVKVFWLNQKDRGAHINISGIAIARYAPHPENALKLVDFMLTDAAQAWYSDHNYEYPIRETVPLNKTVKAMGAFKSETVSMQVIGERNTEALQLMDQVGWR